MPSIFNAKTQRRKDATREIEPRISRIARIRKDAFSIREIRGKKNLSQILFAPLRLCVFALKSCGLGDGRRVGVNLMALFLVGAVALAQTNLQEESMPPLI